MIIKKKSTVLVFLCAGTAFLFTLLNGINLAAQQHPFKFSHLSVENGLSHTDTKDVGQDKLGFIWIATLSGLNRYDGHVIKKFYNTNVPKSNALKNRIRDFYIDGNDKIWIGSEGGIQFFDPRAEKYTDVDNVNRNVNTVVDRIFVLKNSILAVFTENRPRLFVIKGKMLTDISLRYPPGVRFTDMIHDNYGNIWLASNKGLWLLDRSFRFRHFDIRDGSGAPIQYLNKVFVNRLGQLLITAGTTIVLVKVQSQDPLLPMGSYVLKLSPLQYLPIKGCTGIMDIIQDKNLDYWVSTNGGLFLLNRVFGIKQIISAENYDNGLVTNRIGKLMIDRSECLWVCSSVPGIYICDLNAKPFYILKHSANRNSLSGNFIRAVLEEGRRLWIGTSGNGLNEYDFQTLKFKHYTTKSSPLKLKTDEVSTLTLDNDSNLWIGTGNGIQILNKKHNALLKPAGYEKLPSGYISSLVKDCYGNIWFCGDYTFGSITCDKKKIYQVKYQENIIAHRIWADNASPELFVSTTHGLLRMIIDSSGNVVKTFKYSANDQVNPLSSDYVYQVQKRNDSIYSIGTIGGGLNCLILKKDNTYKITAYGSRYGIFNDVEATEFDNKGNIWMGGDGLIRFNLNTKQLTRFDKNDGLQGNSFKVDASYKGKDGRLYFGGPNGLNYFFPDSIKNNPILARPIFTDLLINNKKVVIAHGRTSLDENILEEPVSYSKTLRLNYRQNNFVISFSAMHYANPKKCQYRYRLIGFDKEWKFADGNNPTASYNNLDYNDYSFVVEATNNDGVWSRNKAVIPITVIPPWWKSTPAKSVYLILFLSALIGVYIYQAQWYRLKRELSMRNLEEKKQEELYQQQVNLSQQIKEKNNVLQEADEFKNKLVSILAHDFRSPLVSTISIARLMRDNQHFTEEEMELFYSDIEKDATHMLKSFDTILQWIRQQLSGYQFNAEILMLHDLFDESMALLAQQMETKKIIFCNQIPQEMTLISDKEILQFINRNLLANAIKFSPDGGRITIGCEKNETNLTISVSDDGPGISETSLATLFSVSSQAGHSTHMGAGIAMSMCKDFIKRLDGRIWAENKKPNGAIFYYNIPFIPG
jgi:signal transduction histidine kinase/ligand-binding sensor domain-containing protein